MGADPIQDPSHGLCELTWVNPSFVLKKINDVILKFIFRKESSNDVVLVKN